MPGTGSRSVEGKLLYVTFTSYKCLLFRIDLQVRSSHNVPFVILILREKLNTFFGQRLIFIVFYKNLLGYLLDYFIIICCYVMF